MERTVLQRTFETISTPLGDAVFKVVNIDGEKERILNMKVRSY